LDLGGDVSRETCDTATGSVALPRMLAFSIAREEFIGKYKVARDGTIPV
jgi:hypothetical protein